MTFNLFQPITDFEYILQSIGKTVTVNDVPIQAVITNASNPKNPYDEKFISTLAEIKRGDLINYNSADWLVVNQISDMRYGTKYKGLMRKCEYEINFNFEGNVLTFPVLIDSKIFNVTEDKYFLLPDGTILVTLQENEETKNISIDQRFIKLGFAWKISGIDRTQKGLIILTCDQDQFNIDDDIENEIADYGAYTYSVVINNADPITLNIEDTLQLDVTVTKNGIPIENPSLIYSSSNENICTVSSTGEITAISEGTAEITVSLDNEYYSASDTISINVEEQISDNFSIQIIGDDSIMFGSSKTYTAKFYNNGVEVFDQTGTWSVSNGYASITSQTGTSCIVKAGSTDGVYFNLICTLDSDPNVTAVKTIYIEGWW